MRLRTVIFKMYNLRIKEIPQNSMRIQILYSFQHCICGLWIVNCNLKDVITYTPSNEHIIIRQ